MINQKESKQVRIDSWLLNYCQVTRKQKQKTKINQQTIIKKNPEK